MARSYPFEHLPARERQRASSRFLDAGSGDGYRYELDVEGKVLSRFRPQAVRGQPAPIYANGYLAHQSTD